MTQGPKGDLGRPSGFAEDLVSIDGWRANERMKLAGGSSRCEAAGEVWMDKATCRWQGLQLIRSSVRTLEVIQACPERPIEQHRVGSAVTPIVQPPDSPHLGGERDDHEVQFVLRCGARADYCSRAYHS
jgi:hypothetical protein